MPRSSLGIDEGDAGALCTSLRPAKALILAVVTCVISGSFNFGYFTGIIAGAAVYIQDSYPESSFWKGALVSCILLGAMAGATLSGRLANAVGRRRALMLQAIPFLVGATFMTIGSSFWMLLAARTVAGLGVGLASSLCNLYISEIVPDEHRGRFGAWAPFTVTLGILVSYILAWAAAQLPGDSGVKWRVMLGVSVVAPVAGLIMAPFCLVESPRWLLMQGDRIRATEALTSLVEPGPGVLKAVADVIDRTEAALRQQDMEHALSVPSMGSGTLRVLPETEDVSTALLSKVATRSPWRRLLSPQHTSGLVVGVGLNVLQQVCGINVVVYFAPTVLLRAGFSKTDSILLTAGVGVAQLVATYALMRLVDKIGRRPLNFVGLIAMIASLALMATAFVHDVSQLAIAKWLAVGGMLVFRVAFSLSLGPLPYIITPEVFPSSVRTAGVAVSWAANWVFNFTVSLTFLPLLDWLGTTATFGLYGGFAVLSLLFVWGMVPETNGRDMEAKLHRGEEQ